MKRFFFYFYHTYYSIFFFFSSRRRHTRLQGDWSSDVCSSDLVPNVTSIGAAVKRLVVENVSGFCSSFDNPSLFVKAVRLVGPFVPDAVQNGKIGRASCRERV